MSVPSAVFDCMIFLQGVARPGGPARRCLEYVDRRQVTLYVSSAVLTEVHDVLTRPKTLAKFPLLTGAEAGQLLQAIESKSVHLASVPDVFRYARDPKDEPYVNLAIAADVQFLVSRDNDLLDLMRPDTPEGKDFGRQFPRLTILPPEDFLRRLAPPPMTPPLR